MNVKMEQIQYETKVEEPDLPQRKQTLIEKIVALMVGNNSHNLLALKNAQTEWTSMLLTEPNLTQHISENDSTIAFSTRINELQSDLCEAKNGLTAMKTNNDQIVADLKHEKHNVLAYIKQLETRLQQLECGAE